MKADIHPDYVDGHGALLVRQHLHHPLDQGRDLHVELCSECHPFYTGKQKLVDTGGRIDRFERRYGQRARSRSRAPERTRPAARAAASTPSCALLVDAKLRALVRDRAVDSTSAGGPAPFAGGAARWMLRPATRRRAGSAQPRPGAGPRAPVVDSELRPR